MNKRPVDEVSVPDPKRQATCVLIFFRAKLVIEHNPSFVHSQLAGISPTERIYIATPDGPRQAAVQAPLWPGPSTDLRSNPEKYVEWLREVAIQDRQQNILNHAYVNRNRALAALLWLVDYDFFSPPLVSAVDHYNLLHPIPTGDQVHSLKRFEPDTELLKQPFRPIAVSEQLTAPASELIVPPTAEDTQALENRAKSEADLINRVQQLQAAGLWGASKRVPKLPEPPHKKTHWDFLIGEMIWMSEDFKQERKWKVNMAKRLGKAVMKWHQKQRKSSAFRQKDDELYLRRTAKTMALEVKRFWGKIDKLISHKHQLQIDAAARVKLERNLDFLVGQTERYSAMLAEDLSTKPNEAAPQEGVNVEMTGTARSDAKEKPRAETPIPGEEVRDDPMDVDEVEVEVVEGTQVSDKERMERASALAQDIQPTGTTLSTTTVHTQVSPLIRAQMREYQIIGLDWLVTMYEKKLNGILADEMGLGKTLMTISLLAHLAYNEGNWGPHLIVVPTSLMLNWEMEFKKFCPAFKILTYFGSQRERNEKRRGWSKTNSFHVCITSYKVVVQDQVAFRRKKWKYFILDEAQNIKNFRSQRWQALLNFNSQRRLLLTGTPLQNSLMELWSLMHFLMPHIFQSHSEFAEWFSNPMNQMIEDGEANEALIERIHGVLRPFLLRRLKADVESLPPKTQHIIPCQLSRRQQFLYEEFIASAEVRATLGSGNYRGIANILMQLRKVCNHPDLFEPRPTVSPFDMPGICFKVPSLLEADPYNWETCVDLKFLGLIFPDIDSWTLERTSALSFSPEKLAAFQSNPIAIVPSRVSFLPETHERAVARLKQQRERFFQRISYVSSLHSLRRALFGRDTVAAVKIGTLTSNLHAFAESPSNFLSYSSSLLNLMQTNSQRAESMKELLSNFVCIIPAARAKHHVLYSYHGDPSLIRTKAIQTEALLTEVSSRRLLDHYRIPFVRTQIYFPDRRLVQYDCGKLQKLALLLQFLRGNGSRALIFTQMTKVLDVLEVFLNIYGYTYLRLDGTTKPEQRQMLMERFNADSRIFVFILSTRSGGIGVNLTGANTVIFYDSDWNPAMDAQAQDRAHRIGQTRPVSIYRLVTEHTIEENILKKANQKRTLDEVVITGGGFTPDFFKKVNLRELIEDTPGGLAPPTDDVDLENLVDDADGQALDAADREAKAEFADDFGDGIHRPADEEEDGMLGELVPEHAANQAGKDSVDWTTALTPIQYWALQLLEARYQSEERVENAFDEQPERQEAWELELLRQMKEEEEARAAEEDEVLFYEVEGTSMQAYLATKTPGFQGLPIYCMPPPTDQLYIPSPFDADTFLEPPFFEQFEIQLPPPPPTPKPPVVVPRREEFPLKKRDRRRNVLEDEGYDDQEEDVQSFQDSSARRNTRRPTRYDDEIAELQKSSGLRRGGREERSMLGRRKDPRDPSGPQVDSPSWTQLEDSTLIRAMGLFGPNWDLISDLISSLPRFPRIYRSRKATFDRYRQLVPQMSEKKAIAPGHEDMKFPVFEFFSQPNYQRKEILKNPPSESLTTTAFHESHVTLANSLGGVKTPAEHIEIIAKRAALHPPQHYPEHPGLKMAPRPGYPAHHGPPQYPQHPQHPPQHPQQHPQPHPQHHQHPQQHPQHAQHPHPGLVQGGQANLMQPMPGHPQHPISGDWRKAPPISNFPASRLSQQQQLQMQAAMRAAAPMTHAKAPHPLAAKGVPKQAPQRYPTAPMMPQGIPNPNPGKLPVYHQPQYGVPPQKQPQPMPGPIGKQPSSTPPSSLLALYSLTQLPQSSAQIRDIVRRGELNEDQKVTALRKIISDASAQSQNP